MTDNLYDRIEQANKMTTTTDIKGKDYVMVNQRVRAFRMVYPDGLIQTEIVALKDGIVVFKASAYDEKGRLLATGFAQEKESSSFINKTSYIENCETSAIGRALGFCGFGIDSSIASYEEVANAQANQSKKGRKPSEKDKLLDDLEAQKKKHGKSPRLTLLINSALQDADVKTANELNIAELKELLKAIDSNMNQLDDIKF